MNATPGNNKSSRKTKKDAFQQPNLENSSPANPLKYPSTSPRKERIPLTSFHPGLRDPSPQKPATPPSRKASERRKHQRQKRPVTRTAKNYYLPKTSHHLQKSEAKGRGSRFFHIACMTSYLSVKGSLPPLQLSKLL